MTFIYQATIDHDLMPMPRLSHGKRTARDNRYFNNRNELAWQLMSERKGSAIDSPCSVTFSVHLAHRRKADIDNCIKTVLDAMVYGGVIKDDSQVRHIDGWLHRGAAKGVVMIGVAPLPEEPPRKSKSPASDTLPSSSLGTLLSSGYRRKLTVLRSPHLP